jgi:hypothetical protein
MQVQMARRVGGRMLGLTYPDVEPYIRPSDKTLLCDGNAGADSYSGTSRPIRAKLEHGIGPRTPPLVDRIRAESSFI